MTPPRRNTQSMDLSLDNTPPPLTFTGDALTRLGRVESQVNQMLPIMGKVAESVDNLGSAMQEIKTDMREMRTSFNEFQIRTASYGERIVMLEDCSRNIATQRIEDLAIAKEKAEAIVYEGIREVTKQKIERRNRILTIIGSAIGSIFVAAILTYFGLKR